MSFAWPAMLWLLWLLPVLVIAYLLLLRRRRGAVRYANLALVKEALGPGHRFKRHIPPLLFLLGLAAALLASARPSALVTLPSDQQTIMLAVDVSLSMRANDVEPTRILAAQDAARAFIGEQPPNVKIGIVAFGGTASLVQAPTSDRDELIAAVDRFQLQRATATGSAIAVALSTLFPNDGIDLQSMVFGKDFARHGQPADRSGSAGPRPLQPAQPAQRRDFQPVPPGSYESAVIILLSDGRRTTGPDPLDLARMAADRGVRIYTVGFGTVDGARVDFGEWSIYVRLDEETLKQVAQITRGEYFHAATGADLQKVYQQLNSRYVLEKRETEISALFAGLAALLLVAAGALSMLWFNRVA
jgi:Ca-activated chloride channel family protein